MNHLLLCSGRDKPCDEGINNYVTLDGNEENHPDILAIIPPFPQAVRDVEWDSIELIHGIEHFPIWQALPLLKECCEVLKPGGTMVLELPNALFAAKVLLGLQKPLTDLEHQCGLWVFYGDPRYENMLQLHKWGWWPESLTKALLEAGFSRVVETPARYHLPGRDFRLEATK